MPERRRRFPTLAEPHDIDGRLPDLLDGIAADRAYLVAEKNNLAQRFHDTCLIPLRDRKIKQAQDNPEGVK